MKVWSADASRDGRRAELLLGAATAAIVVIPFATVLMPTRLGMLVQAAAIIGVTLALLAVGLLRPGTLGRLAGIPRVAAIAVAAYAAVAVLGAASALTHGNAPAQAAGQLVSLGLLPLGAAAAWALGAPRAVRSLASWIVGVALIFSLVHLGSWVKAALTRTFFPRLYLSNNVSIAGVALLALTLALAYFVTTRGWRVPALLGVVATLLVVIVGSGTRSLWVATPATAGLFLCLWLLFGHSTRLRTLLLLLPAVAALFAAWFAADSWYQATRPNLIPGRLFAEAPWRIPAAVKLVTVGEPPRQRQALRWQPPECVGREFGVTDPFPVPGPGAYSVRASMREEGGTTEAYLLVQWLTAERKPCGYMILRAYPRGDWSWRDEADVAPAQTAYAQIVLGCKQYGDNPWMLDDIRLERLGPSALHALFMQVRFTKRRIGGLVSFLQTGSSGDPSVVGRLAETQVVLGLLRNGTAAEKLFGFGLGAKFVPPEERGLEVNYLHNYYAFFIFKTGWVGTLLGVGALAAFVAITFTRARRAREPRDAALLWAVLAAWIGYLAWSNVCPEILDFRMAPLWGFLVAAVAGSATEQPGLTAAS